MSEQPNFKKILEHKDQKKILSRLVQGDDPKDISQSLKLKYSLPEEGSLRLPAALLEEFRDKYLNEFDFLEKVKESERNGTDKKIYASLVNNKAWQDRIATLADEEIDVKKELKQLMHMIKVRAEQVFDKIQQNPEGMKVDYVFIKYLERIESMTTTINKVVNQAPDMIVQHNHSVQLIEQTGVVFQNVIKEILMEMDPEISALFMDKLQEKLSVLKLEDATPLTPEQRHFEAKKLLDKNAEDAEYTFEEA